MWLSKPKNSTAWQVRFKHPDGSGRIICRSTSEAGRRAAEARAKAIVDDATAEWAKHQSGGSISTSAVIEEYWRTELVKKKWQASAKVHLDRIARFLGDRPYCEISIADVAKLLDELDDISPSSQNRLLAVWRRMHNVAQNIRRYPVQPIAWSAVARDEPEGRNRHLNEDEIKQAYKIVSEATDDVFTEGQIYEAQKETVEEKVCLCLVQKILQ